MKFNRLTDHRKHRKPLVWLVIPTAVMLVLIAGHIGVTRSSFVDTETIGENSFQAWASTVWTQTLQADFEAGITSRVDTSSSAGNVLLAESGASVYYESGNVTSLVLDTGTAGTVWNALSWDETVPENTDITLEVRASDTVFLVDAAEPSWSSAGGDYPVISGLPDGRYIQWRATLTTSDTAVTPVLQEVRIYYH